MDTCLFLKAEGRMPSTASRESIMEIQYAPALSARQRISHTDRDRSALNRQEWRRLRTGTGFQYFSLVRQFSLAVKSRPVTI
jgi:hypothetical protein